MNPQDPMTWMNLGGMGLLSLVIYLELRGMRKDMKEELTAFRKDFMEFVERLVILEERTRNDTPVHGVPVTGEGRRYHHKREKTPPPR